MMPSCCTRAGATEVLAAGAYYAMFNAARALLDMRGYGPEAVKTHAGVLRLFSLEFVNAGSLTAEYGRALRTAERLRNLADYDPDPITAENARPVIEFLHPFLEAVERLLANGQEQIR